VLTELGISRAGFDISRAIRGARGNNADALFDLVNNEINSFAGKSNGTRGTWSTDELQAAYDALDEIGDEVVGSICSALEGNV
jgi:DNA repair protein RadD